MAKGATTHEDGLWLRDGISKIQIQLKRLKASPRYLKNNFRIKSWSCGERGCKETKVETFCIWCGIMFEKVLFTHFSFPFTIKYTLENKTITEREIEGGGNMNPITSYQCYVWVFSPRANLHCLRTRNRFCFERSSCHLFTCNKISSASSS